MTAADAPLLLALPLLLLASSLFSGSETALFGLSHAERLQIRRAGGPGDRAVRALLANPRELLITLMIGNMGANVTYFVVSSVLTLRADSPAWAVAYSVGPLLSIILLGEVLPKLVATTHRAGWCGVLSPVILAFHGVVTPLRRPVRAIIEPLIRLVSTPGAPAGLTGAELGDLLERSAAEGVIDADEARLIDAVAAMGGMRVRDVMTPRVDVRWLRASARRAGVLRFLQTGGATYAPVCKRSLDEGVLGVVDLKRYLARAQDKPVAAAMSPPLFVPEHAPLDGLLETLRARRLNLAVVVDEYGAVVGVASLVDIVDRLIGAVDERPGEAREPVVEPLADGVYRVPGRLALRGWREVFAGGANIAAATVGGLVMELLGRVPREGDTVRLGNIVLRVERMTGYSIDTVQVSVDRATGSAP